MAQAFPEASVHNVTGSWWEAGRHSPLVRGSLVRTIVPYPDLKPFRLIPGDRGDDPRQHAQARFRIEEFRVGTPVSGTDRLPVAGMPLRLGESYLVRRGKVRPAVVLATEGMSVDPRFARTGSSWQHKPALLLAPYYGVEADGTRAGWDPEFVSRIQRAEYSQYVWDVLPVGGAQDGSILRLDHVFPLGSDPASWSTTEYKLRGDAIEILDEWLQWHLSGVIPSPESTTLGYIRAELVKL